MTQEELGQLIGVQKAQISKLESSANSATNDTIIKVFRALKAEINFNVKLDKIVRTAWDAEQEKWFFSIIDVIEILTSSPRPRKYWNALKTKLKVEGSELSHKLGQLKMPSTDGKFYLTYCPITKIKISYKTLLISWIS